MRSSPTVFRAAGAFAALLVLGPFAACRTAETGSLSIEDRRPAVSSALMSALRSPDPDLRRQAAVTMGRTQDPAYVGALIEASAEADGDESREVRLAALFALGQLGLAEGALSIPAAREACLLALDDPDSGIAAAAVEALGKQASMTDVETLIQALSHPAPEVRREAALALFRLRFVPAWRKETNEPPPLPTEAVEALLATAGDSEPDVRRAAIYAFSRFGQPGAGPALAGYAADADPWVRLFAIRGAGRSGDPAVAEALVPGMRDKVAAVRAETVLAIAELDAGAHLLAELARDVSFHVRSALATAVGGWDAPSAPNVLRLLANDPSISVRVAATEAIARRDPGSARPIVDRAIASDDWRLRAAGARAALHLGDDAPRILDAALQDEDNRVRVAALESLGELGGGNDAILAALTSDDLASRGTAVAIVAQRETADRLQRLGEAYEGSPGAEWVEVRESIAGELEQVEGAEKLLRRIATTDSAGSVQRRAASSLRAMGLEAPLVRQPAAEAPEIPRNRFDEDPVVVLETTLGKLEIRCFADAAPVHVANFVRLVEEGFYDGLIWHRVVPNFVIQGGDPRGDGWGGAGNPLRDEIHPGRFERGSVGMPKAGKDTGDGQLFITHVPTPHLDGNYTVFGQVISGMSVIDQIEVGDQIVRATVR